MKDRYRRRFGEAQYFHTQVKTAKKNSHSLKIFQVCREYVSHSKNLILYSQFITEIHTCVTEITPELTYEEDDKCKQNFGKNFAFLGYYAASGGNFLPTFLSLI
jgi:hypothetical protein